MRRMQYIRMTRRTRFAVWCTVALAVPVLILVTMLVRLKPILVNMAVSRVSNSVNRIVAAAVNDAVRQGAIDYDMLVTLEKDADGRVTALRSNMGEVSRLQTRISDEILERLGEVSTAELAIPLGSLTGSALLASRGPALRVRIQSVGSVTASFRNDFTSAGINQTKHRILLRIDVSMSILLPTFNTSTKVSNEIAVAETVIVGGVPDSYTNFSTAPSELEQYAEDYILNIG